MSKRAKTLKAEIDLLTRWNFSDKSICDLLDLKTCSELKHLRNWPNDRL